MSDIRGSTAETNLVERKVQGALRGKIVSKNCYEILSFNVELPKGQTLGLTIKKDTVVGIKWDSPCLGVLQPGDILYTINKEVFPDDHNKSKGFMLKMNNHDEKCAISVIRFKRRPTMKPIIPIGYQPLDGFVYEWTMVYLMRGMSLGLDVRLIDGKIYVADILPQSIASMSLLIGECIVDVEGELVKSIPQLTSSMVRAMDRNGQARLLVEAPSNDMHRNILRAKIAAVLGPPIVKDLPLPPETKPWIEKGLAALKEKEPKSVYKPPGLKKSESGVIAKRSTHFNEKTVELSYYDDLQTSLIVKVPPPRTSEEGNQLL